MALTPNEEDAISMLSPLLREVRPLGILGRAIGEEVEGGASGPKKATDMASTP